MIGRVWAWDAQQAGAFYLDDDGRTLLHVQAYPRAGFEWDNPVEVDFERIDECLVVDAERARAKLQHWGHCNRERIRGGLFMFRQLQLEEVGT